MARTGARVRRAAGAALTATALLVGAPWGHAPFGAAARARAQMLPPFEGRPDLAAYASPGVAAALTSPERLWRFLTAPETPFTDRVAAATQGKSVFPLAWLPRLLRARQALQDEQRLHRWGLDPSPRSSVAFRLPAGDLKTLARERHVLGHAWRLPAQSTGTEPGMWQEAGRVPWPWQAQCALESLFLAIAPRMSVGKPPDEIAYAEKWYAVALGMPCRTDREALAFVEATQFPLHYKTLPVLARWRRIALDARCPQAAQRVASMVGEAMRLWGDPRAQDIGQAMIADIMRGSKESRVRFQAAWSATHLMERFTGTGDVKLPPPLYVSAAIGEAALDEKAGSPWDRLYCYAEPVCALVPDPPLTADINRMTPGSPQALAALDTFCAWFRAHKGSMAEAGQKQIRAWDAIAAIRKGR